MSAGRRGQGDRAPRAERGGAFGGFLTPRPAVDVGMPTMRSSFVRGLAVVASTPGVVIAIPVVLALVWLGAVAAGYQGPFVLLAHTFALPPVGTASDVSVAARTFPGAAIVAVAVTIVFRALVVAAVTGVAVRSLRDGRVDRWVWVPALRSLRAAVAVSLASVSVLFLAQLIGAFLGGAAGFGLFLQIGAFVLGITAFTYAPVIAATEDRRLADALSRSWRAARIPGTGGLSLATLYVLPSLMVLLAAPALPGGDLGVNPTVGAWIFVIVTNLIHVSVAAMYAYRYLSIADHVPEPPAPAPRRR
ncbi:MAG TPA: hypothetical protein VLA82_09455 [Actinomycetota bacterium]|nr:hypothetical protein [Actinomycetota bacterium]